MSRTLVDTSHLEEALGELVDEGMLRSDQAAAIRQRLAAEQRAEPSPAPLAARATLAAAYVGVGLVLAAVATFIGQSWDSLNVLSRTVVFVALTALLVGAGVPLKDRYDSARGLAWLAAVISAGGLGAAVFSADSVDSGTTVVAGASTALVAASVLLWLRREAAQLLAFAAAVFALLMSIAARFELPAGAGGPALWGLGLGFAAAAMVGWLPARPLAMVLGGLMSLAGAQFAGASSLLLCTVLAVVLAASAYLVALREEPAVPLTIATLTVATIGPRVLGQWLHGSLGGPGVLAISGLIILGAAAAHVRLTRMHSDRQEGPSAL